MFARRRAVAACLAISFLGLAFLFLHAKSITPRSMSLAEIGGDDIGAPVRVRAHVHRAWTTDDADASVVLLDYADFATIRVVARARSIAQPDLVAPGALIEVVGTVFGSAGSVQIFAEDQGAVVVLAPPNTNLLPLEFVARNAVRLEGHQIVVRATLADLRALVDPRHALLRANGSVLWAFSASGWTEGRADVPGRLMVSSRGRCELFASPEPHAVDVELAALSACPAVLLDQPVLVRNVTVDPGETVGTSLTLRDLGDSAEYRVAAFVRGWDWREAPDPPHLGDLVTLEGAVEYQATEARWRIVCERPPRT